MRNKLIWATVVLLMLVLVGTVAHSCGKASVTITTIDTVEVEITKIIKENDTIYKEIEKVKEKVKVINEEYEKKYNALIDANIDQQYKFFSNYLSSRSCEGFDDSNNSETIKGN